MTPSVSVSGRNSYYLGMLAGAYARAGRRAEALRTLDELRRLRKSQSVTPGAFVFAFAGLGDREAMLAALYEAFSERANTIKWLKVDPLFDSLRGDPRFADLMRRAGLE